MLYDSRKILDIVTALKEIKVSSFSCHGGSVDFHNVTQICRIVDTLMLPLYYIWDKCCHQQLKDISFEEHLRKPYQKFMKNPITYTWHLYIFVVLKETIPKELVRKKIDKEITLIYKELIDSFEEGHYDFIQNNALPL